VIGLGGGGDVVGSLAVARLCQAFGAEFVLGGVAWERMPIDPHPGPRPLSEIRAAEPLSETVALAGETTSTPEGVLFAESGMARFLCTRTVLVDVTPGPARIADGVAEAAARLGCDAAIFVDVGGDVLAQGTEPGLASPLCDAVMLAAAARLAPRLPTLGAVFGPGCDGELTPEEVLGRISVLGQAGALAGAWGLTPAVAEQIEAAARLIPTEASPQAVRCLRGETGEVAIRGGRRTVHLSAAGALTFFFDPIQTLAQAPLAGAVAECESLEEARDALAALGVRTELDYERARAAGGDPALDR
jgi:hypothetical protein